jgi:hypothetical protein
METGGMFDWTLFNNSSQTTFVQRLQKVGMFDSNYVQLELCSTRIIFDGKLTIVKQKIN